LTWFKLELPAIELYRNYLRLERHQAGDTANLGIGLTIGPCPQMLSSSFDDVPGRGPEVGVPSFVLVALKRFWRDISLRKIGHWIPAGFKEQKDVLAVGDPCSTEAHPHAPPQWSNVQKPLRQRLGNQEATNCSWSERTLLPGQSQSSPFHTHIQSKELAITRHHHAIKRSPDVNNSFTWG
jgi:hypothetical protein